MRYVLTQFVTSTEGLIEITKNEYDEMIKSKDNLLELLYIEEKFNLLLENHFEFEATIFEIAATYMINLNPTYETFQNDRYLVIRRIINLLSASRLYIDHFSHHLSNISNNLSNNIKNFAKAEYEMHFSYRFMEALRNHVQHRGIPFHKLTLGANRVKKTDKIQFSATPFINTSILIEDNKFKSNIRAEIIEKKLEEINLSVMVRKYISGIGRIHSAIRESTSQLAERSESLIFDTINLFKEKFEESIIALGIGLENDDGTITGIVHIVPEAIDRKNDLMRKNRSLGNLENRFVSSESVE